MRRPARLVAVLTCAAALAAGCWDARGLEQRGFVVMIGVDRLEDDRFRVSLQSEIGRGLRAGGGGGGGGEQEGPREGFRVITGESETVEAGMAKAGADISRELDLAFADTIVIGERAAADLSRLDFFARSNRFPVAAFVTVARGEAERVIRARTPGFPLAGQYTLHGFSGAWNRSAAIVPVYVWMLFQRNFFTPLEDPFVTAVTGEKYGLNWDGLAVFRSHELAGFLSPEETALFNLVRGWRNQMSIVAAVPGGEGGRAALMVDHARSRPRVTWTSAGPVLHVGVDVAGTVQEMVGMRVANRATQARLEGALAKSLADQIAGLLRRLQRLGTDPMGFGELARRADPYRPEVQGRRAWHEAYAEARIDVRVRVEITGTGYMK